MNEHIEELRAELGFKLTPVNPPCADAFLSYLAWSFEARDTGAKTQIKKFRESAGITGKPPRAKDRLVSIPEEHLGEFVDWLIANYWGAAPTKS